MEARRIAAQFLKDYGKDGRFHVWISEADDIDLIAERLREFGCVARINPIKREIEVEPPLDDSNALR